MATQQEINEHYQDLTDGRNEEIVKMEKEYYKAIEKEYREAQIGLQALLLPLFASLVSKEGILTQKELTSFNRLKKLENEAAKELKKVLAAEKKLMNAPLKQLIQDEYYFNLFLIAQKGHYFKMKRITDKEINEIMAENWAGELYTASLLKKKTETLSSISKDLIRGSVDGLTIKEASSILDKRINSALKHSLLVYQNELSRKKTKASDLATDKSGLEDEIYQFIATLDAKTCSHCAPADGKRMKRSEWRISPPLHPSCRCRFILVVKNWEQSVRAGRDLLTQKTYTTLAKDYKEWLKEQGL